MQNQQIDFDVDSESKVVLDRMKLAELTVETTPQAALQGYVAVSHGYLDPSDEAHFSWVFCISLLVSHCMVGITFAICEKGDEMSLQKRSVSWKYTAVLATFRVVELASKILSVSLFTCAFKLLVAPVLYAEALALVAVGYARTLGLRVMHLKPNKDDEKLQPTKRKTKLDERLCLMLGSSPVLLPLLSMYYLNSLNSRRSSVTPHTRSK